MIIGICEVLGNYDVYYTALACRILERMDDGVIQRFDIWYTYTGSKDIRVRIIIGMVYI